MNLYSAYCVVRLNAPHIPSDYIHLVSENQGYNGGNVRSMYSQ